MHKTEAKLEDILNRTNDWLKFAEAKNGVFIALNCAIVFGVFRIISSLEAPPEFIKLYSGFSVVMLLASVIVGLLSFMPRLDPPWGMSFPDKNDSINIFYFGDICSLTPRTYLDEFYKAHNAQGDYSEIDSQYSNQIVINSKIAFIKYLQFNIVTWFTIAALLTPVGALLLSFAKKKI